MRTATPLFSKVEKFERFFRGPVRASDEITCTVLYDDGFQAAYDIESKGVKVHKASMIFMLFVFL
jgi:hypothetical protein